MTDSYQPIAENDTFSIVTLGCAKNTVETEFVEGSLLKHGYRIAGLDDAQVIIVNTCGFINAAKEQSIETILELAKYKEDCKCKALIVAGCLAQRYQAKLLNAMPEIDAVIGLSDLKDLHLHVSEILRGKRICNAGALPGSYDENRARNFSGRPYAYMQISDGCDNFCTYCAIPMIRGRYRSRPIGSLLSEARGLVKQGVKEVVLIGQDTSVYGSDLYGEPKIETLIKKLEKLEGLEWIRLLYCQPRNFSSQLIAAIANSYKVCPYVDIPFQHASKEILSKMGRKGDSEEYLRLIQRIRNEISDVAIRTSFIIGFPGESDRDFDELVQFIGEIKFDYIGLFEYSREENTAAYSLPNHVPMEVVRERLRVISDLRDNLAVCKGRLFLGRKVRALVENVFEEKNNSNSFCYQGRTIHQAPEVDGELRVRSAGRKLRVGDVIKVEIKNVDLYDFEGEFEC